MDKKLIQLVREIKELDNTAKNYINKLITPIDSFLVDNEYSRCNRIIQRKLLNEVFGDMYEDILWFLHEWQPGFTIEVRGLPIFIINTEEDYYKYLETQ